jgi:FKBP-type peptidyl-prolyl cis-trans isomerase
MRFFLLAFLASSLVASIPAQALEMANDEQKTIYALGVAVAKGLSQFDLSQDELKFLLAGIADQLGDGPLQIPIQTYSAQIDQFGKQRRAKLAEDEKSAAEAFLGRAAAEPGAITTDSGLIFREVEAGTGATPQPTDVVQVHYHGTLHDGTVFDSSVERGAPARFPVNRVIACWTEALQRMKVGGKAMITCPAKIGYGNVGAGDKIKPGATLRFDVELLAIEP